MIVIIFSEYSLKINVEKRIGKIDGFLLKKNDLSGKKAKYA
jgi:hypothetical protein